MRFGKVELQNRVTYCDVILRVSNSKTLKVFIFSLTRLFWTLEERNIENWIFIIHTTMDVLYSNDNLKINENNWLIWKTKTKTCLRWVIIKKKLFWTFFFPKLIICSNLYWLLFIDWSIYWLIVCFLHTKRANINFIFLMSLY